MDITLIEKIVLSEVDEWIDSARLDSDKLRMHYYGEGSLSYITRMEGLESEKQYELRKKHHISNKFLCENLLNPVSNIWTAKGGSLSVDSTKKDYRTKVEEIQTEVRLYLKNVCKDRVFTDPNGLLFIENDNKEAWLTYKSIHKIKNMSIKRHRQIEYICFEPHEETKDYSLLWFVDAECFYEYKIADKKATLNQEPIKNIFGYIPAIQNSQIIDTNRDIKISPIWNQIELLDCYLTDNSTVTLYRKLHDYPFVWMYAQPCKECKGTGFTDEGKCTHCNGTGDDTKKYVDNVILLRPPKNETDPQIAPNIAGYIQAPAVFEEHRNQLSSQFDLIFYSHWGTTKEKSQNNETATGRFIDAQMVNNKLNLYSDLFQTLENFAVNGLMKYQTPETKPEIISAFGRDYLTETGRELWQNYLDAKEKEAPIATLNQLLTRYYETEFANNDTFKMYYEKLMLIEPYLHFSIDKLNDEQKNKRFLYQEWLNTKTIAEIIITPIDVLLVDLNKYVELNTNDNGREDNQRQNGGEGSQTGREGETAGRVD